MFPFFLFTVTRTSVFWPPDIFSTMSVQLHTIEQRVEVTTCICIVLYIGTSTVFQVFTVEKV